VFEVGQLYNKIAVYAMQKIFPSNNKVKVRKSDGYTMLSIKNKKVLEDMTKTLDGKMLGIKSFEYKV
jgi:hypothetical protein